MADRDTAGTARQGRNSGRRDYQQRGSAGRSGPPDRRTQDRSRGQGRGPSAGRGNRQSSDVDRGGEGRSGTQQPGPAVDADIDVRDLDKEIKRELRSLPTGLADAVGQHLLMAGRLIDDDPALAVRHAEHAHRLASRVACVREALAVAAYATGDYRVALREARTVRRMRGDDAWLPLIADCERGLGRPEKALEVLRETDLAALPPEAHAEGLIVMAGARQDLGQTEAALALLDNKLLRSRKPAPWVARMRLAYSGLLAAAGREEEAGTWARMAAAADPDGATVHAERRADLDLVEIWEVPEEELAPGAAADPEGRPAARAADSGGAGGPEGPGDSK